MSYEEIMEDVKRPKFRTDTCETHGDFESRHLLGRWIGCAKCAAERQAEAARIDQEERERADAKRAVDRLERAGIKPRFLDKTLMDFRPDCNASRAAFEFSVDYADRIAEGKAEGQCVIFVGRPGTGKTHLASGIARKAVEAGLHVTMATTIQIIRHIKETWGKDSDSKESAEIDRFVSKDLLILDEVGVQFGSETEKLILFEILNGRYEQRRPTVFISNLPVNDLKAFLGERVFDRIREDKGQVIVFDWGSKRGN